jgi:hypothetical protein
VPTTSDAPIWREQLPPGGGLVKGFARPLHFDNGLGVRSTALPANDDGTAPGADSIVNINT